MARKKIEIDPPRNPVLDNLPDSSFQPVAGAKPALSQEGGPLPLGKPVTAQSLTPKERSDLEAIGWKDGEPIPGNLADVIALEVDAANRAATDTSAMPPPASPDIPPLQMPKEISLDQLPEHQKQVLSQVLESAGDQYEALKTRESPLLGADPSVQAAAAGRTDREIPIVNDRTEAEAPKPQINTGDPDPKKLCPRCDWDLSVEDAIVITEEDKNTFLIATLGGQPWQKAFDLFGGRMQVMVRQLRPYEVDACYKQARQDQNKDPENVPFEEFWETLMRYRLCLQLVEVRSGEDITDFPTDLKAWGAAAEGELTMLPRVEEKIFGTVITTESTARVLTHIAGQFGRVVAKLEVQVENPDFWAEASLPV